MKGAIEELILELVAAESTVERLARRLDIQFAERFDMGEVNPASLLKRVLKIQGELPDLRAECQELIQRKQELVDGARQQLLANRRRIQDLAARSGCMLKDDSDEVQAFTQAMAEWQQHVVSTQDTGTYDRGDLNAALARSMLK